MASSGFLRCAALLLAGLLWAGSAQAEEEEQKKGFDINGDGLVTFQEVMKYLEPSVKKTFDAMDRNKDGVLSDKDFDDLREGMKQLEQWLDKLLIKPFEPEPEPENEVTRT